MAFLSSLTNQVHLHPFGCKILSSVFVIITEETSHINILFLVFLLLLFWFGINSWASRGWSSSHGGHLGKTSFNHFVEVLSIESSDHFVDLFFVSTNTGVLEEFFNVSG